MITLKIDKLFEPTYGIGKEESARSIRRTAVHFGMSPQALLRHLHPFILYYTNCMKAAIEIVRPDLDLVLSVHCAFSAESRLEMGQTERTVSFAMQLTFDVLSPNPVATMIPITDDQEIRHLVQSDTYTGDDILTVKEKFAGFTTPANSPYEIFWCRVNLLRRN